MTVKDIMTENPACCRADTPLPEVARLMCDNDCGIVPVVDERGRPIGVISDRDIACRVVAERKDALKTTARDCMSTRPITVRPDATVEECCQLLEQSQIRRIVVVDANGVCCGVVAQADIALNASEKQTGEVVREVSRAAPMSAAMPAPLMNV